MEKTYRKLTADEIQQLKSQGCSSPDWQQIEVADGFLAANVRGSCLAGHVRLGANDKVIVNYDGVRRSAGIYNSELIDCTVGDNVFISNIGAYIHSYDIADEAYIESVGKIVCTGKNRFGNGVSVRAVNEGGGREVTIHDNLTAQRAYLEAMYRHRPELVARLKEMAGGYCAKIDPARGKIARGARISGCNTIRDVNVGEYAILNGISILTNGTVNSNCAAITYMGAGVKAHDFICAPGAYVDNGAALNRCFIGEACRIDYGYTVTDSLFFANSECANGEACSIFAGPYTVSHHKSSLLIAGYFLFFNAGSGANQSNHLFKAGPVHQGIHERGCKFASNAYVMLPARDGAFTVVLGRHSSHHDTSDFPFSYLVEEDTKSYLLPAINLKSYGTLRDMEKWRRRDRRGPRGGRDMISFEEHNPYIGSKLLKALIASRKMLGKQGVETYIHNRIRIKAVMLRRGMQIYELALDALLGSILSERGAEPVQADAHWVDIAGMFAPRNEIEQLAGDIETGLVGSYEDIDRRFAGIHARYRDHAYSWALLTLGNILGREPEGSDIDQAVERGEKAVETLTAMRREDAGRDSDQLMKTGYGIDSILPQETDADFSAVRNK